MKTIETKSAPAGAMSVRDGKNDYYIHTLINFLVIMTLPYSVVIG